MAAPDQRFPRHFPAFEAKLPHRRAPSRPTATACPLLLGNQPRGTRLGARRRERRRWEGRRRRSSGFVRSAPPQSAARAPPGPLRIGPAVVVEDVVARKSHEGGRGAGEAHGAEEPHAPVLPVRRVAHGLDAKAAHGAGRRSPGDRRRRATRQRAALTNQRQTSPRKSRSLITPASVPLRPWSARRSRDGDESRSAPRNCRTASRGSSRQAPDPHAAPETRRAGRRLRSPQ